MDFLLRKVDMSHNLGLVNLIKYLLECYLNFSSLNQMLNILKNNTFNLIVI